MVLGDDEGERVSDSRQKGDVGRVTSQPGGGEGSVVMERRVVRNRELDLEPDEELLENPPLAPASICVGLKYKHGRVGAGCDDVGGEVALQ